jgi:hypothetical protein
MWYMNLAKILILETDLRCNSYSFMLTLVTRPQFSALKAMQTFFETAEIRQPWFRLIRY